ncbi:MAG: hypothetical protein Q8K58_06370 [Acidimicrobiales bacterium]|nr:hypothetical protein [Acidimicrobiales bacterium]
MSSILDTVVSYEDQIVDFVKQAKKPVVEYVAKGVELVEGRLPDVTYPASLPTPTQVVETQATFAKKMIDVNTNLVTAVLDTVGPLVGIQKAKVVKAASKAA